jgi:hypothetical protein
LYNKSFFVIDDFYPDPDQIRHNVLSGDGFSWFPTKVSLGYPNGNAPWLGKMTKERYLAERKVDFVVSAFTGKNVAPLMNIDHGCFRLTCESDVPGFFNHQIHADSISNEKADWAGVLYLTPVSESIEGTIFYKNKKLNKSRFTEKADYTTITETSIDDPAQWQKELVSYFVYNRLIVYRGDLFHSPGPAFGKDDNTGRLVQLFMWKEL